MTRSASGTEGGTFVTEGGTLVNWKQHRMWGNDQKCSGTESGTLVNWKLRVVPSLTGNNVRCGAMTRSAVALRVVLLLPRL